MHVKCACLICMLQWRSYVMPGSLEIKLKPLGSLKTRARAQAFRFTRSCFVANPELWMIQHELLPHTTAHRVTEDVAYIYMYEINENCGHGEQNIRTTRLYGELDKKWPSWTSWAEPSHARAEPELSSVRLGSLPSLLSPLPG